MTSEELKRFKIEQAKKNEYQRLYEQAKRVIVQLVIQANIVTPTDPNSAFILACRECGLPFRNDIEVGIATEHMKLEHNTPDNKLEMDLIYIGKGDPPKGNT